MKHTLLSLQHSQQALQPTLAVWHNDNEGSGYAIAPKSEIRTSNDFMRKVREGWDG